MSTKIATIDKGDARFVNQLSSEVVGKIKVGRYLLDRPNLVLVGVTPKEFVARAGGRTCAAVDVTGQVENP